MRLIRFFPSSDDWDVMRWEAVALDLAARSGITAPDWQIHEIDGKGVLIVTRFDRTGDRRVGYVSAMTMLEAVDGDGIETLLEVAELFRLRPDDSRHVLAEVAEATRQWRNVATANELTPAAIDEMEPAFVHELAETAHELAVA
jgi:serine/threonine-protein kinase HipA